MTRSLARRVGAGQHLASMHRPGALWTKMTDAIFFNAAL